MASAQAALGGQSARQSRLSGGASTQGALSAFRLRDLRAQGRLAPGTFLWSFVPDTAIVGEFRMLITCPGFSIEGGPGTVWLMQSADETHPHRIAFPVPQPIRIRWLNVSVEDAPGLACSFTYELYKAPKDTRIFAPTGLDCVISGADELEAEGDGTIEFQRGDLAILLLTRAGALVAKTWHAIGLGYELIP